MAMDNNTVLYIEKDYHNRRFVRKILNSRGFEALEAEDGVIGFDMINDLHPTMVLIEMNLPGMDGLEVVKRMKLKEEVCTIPVIALTASNMPGDRERFIDAGCDDYLFKPVRAPDLVSMVLNYEQ
ncbi:MAG: response regulator [Chloroflexi bacterium]|nr:response regulator [Chloroflexota bacterium]